MQFSNILYKAATPSTMADKISISVQTLVVGMLVVFAVLTVIMLVVMLVGSFFKAKDGKKTIQKDEAPVQEAASSLQPAEVASVSSATDDDGMLIAAITAAVSLYMEEDVGSFRVVSFRKTATRTPWNKK